MTAAWQEGSESSQQVPQPLGHSHPINLQPVCEPTHSTSHGGGQFAINPDLEYNLMSYESLKGRLESLPCRRESLRRFMAMEGPGLQGRIQNNPGPYLNCIKIP